MSEASRVDRRVDGAIATLIITNPKHLNAMTSAMWRTLSELLDELDCDDAIRVITIEGAGDRAFCSGADLSEKDAAAVDAPMDGSTIDASAAAIKAISRCGKPVVAKIRGVCMGGGMEIASACDLRIAAEDARFRMPAARLGIGYPFDGIRRYVALMGVEHTFDIFATARPFDGIEALRLGFVGRACPAVDLDAQATALTATISALAPLTLRAMKLSVNACAGQAMSERLARIQEAIDTCLTSDDFKEGVAAFQQKRPARFVGR